MSFVSDSLSSLESESETNDICDNEFELLDSDSASDKDGDCSSQIKVKHSWLGGPWHALFQLKQLKYQKGEVIAIVKKTVKRSAWFAFSECIIQTLLCSNNEEEQKLRVQKVLEIREKGDDNTQFGNNSVRCYKIPSINTDADNLMDLIEWKDSVYNQLLTTSHNT